MGTVKIFGKEVETKYVILGVGAAAVVGLAIYNRRKQAAQPGEVFDGSGIGGGLGGAIGGGGGPAGTSGTGDGGGLGGGAGDGGSGVVNGLFSVVLDYTQDTSNELQFEGYRKSGGSSGLSLGGFGGSLGLSNSNQSEKGGTYVGTVKDVFNNQSVAENIGQSQLTTLLDYFARIGGTYDERQRALDARNAAMTEQAYTLFDRVFGRGSYLKEKVKAHIDGVTKEQQYGVAS